MATSKKKAKKPTPKKATVKKSAPKKSIAKKAAKKSPPSLAKVIPLAKAKHKINADFLQPLEDRLLVSVEGPSEKTAGGLYIPETAADRPHRGRVLALGRGRRNKKGLLRPLDVTTGDTVLFNELASTKITVEGEEFLILREEDVLGIVT